MDQRSGDGRGGGNLIFVVEGKPQAKQRPRVLRNGITYTPKETKLYEERVRQCYQEQIGKKLEGPIWMEIRVFLAIPKSYPQYRRVNCIGGMERPTKKPDWDNIGKSISDALNKVAYDDDSAIVDVRITKHYAENERVEINIGEAI